MESYSIKNLTFAYPEQERIVLDDISINVEKGQFVVLCGPSGCGKTTLLRQLKSVLAPHGQKKGEILFEGIPIDKLDQRNQSSRIGFVLQSPENQIVTDKVWHELAFGLESLGMDTPSIRLRVAEMASFFGIQNWFYKNVTELSGGQKQLLNLAAIMAMQPSVLILDEPTSQLDPIAASDFLATVAKINRELGTTIILTEHRLDEALPLADRAIVMDNGKIIADGEPGEVGQLLGRENNKMFLAMPVPMRIYAGVPNKLSCPVTVREGRQWLDSYSRDKPLNNDFCEKKSCSQGEEPAAEIIDAWFKYEKDLPDVVKGASLTVYKGELLAIMGGNGTGKTTTLSLLSGLNKPYRGTVKIFGRDYKDISNSEKFNGMLGVLPQNPQSLFVKKTVELDLYEMFKGRKLSKDECKRRVMRVSRMCQLTDLLNRHPYDLSGGEQQRAALAKVLLTEPDLLLLDEPTKGMDAEFKRVFASIIYGLLKEGTAVVMVSHDIEFCASYASRCALFFDGSIVTEGTPERFFSGNSFYTTAANRMARHLLPAAVTVEDVVRACGGNVSKDDYEFSDDGYDYMHHEEIGEINNAKEKNKCIGRYIVSIASLIVMIISGQKAYPVISDLAWSALKGNVSENSAYLYGWKSSLLAAVFIVSIAAFFLSVFQRASPLPESILQVAKDKRKLSKRTTVSAILMLLFIPLTIFIGVYYLEDKKYYFISLMIVLQTMIPFAMIFEGRNPQARELVVITVLCAIGMAGRAAFFMLPHFKPVAAVVIIAGIAFGGEGGFMVGAMTMLLSNIMFGQGPWTPWQMFAMGIIGFLAGVLFKKGFLRRDRISMAIFGFVAVFVVYGGIMDPASAIMWQRKITLSVIATYMVMGVPVNLVHASATFLFMILMGEAMLEKLDRIKVKYGLAEDVVVNNP